MLETCARCTLRKAHHPQEWLGDLTNEAMLLLARQLSHLPDGSNAVVERPSRGWLLVATRGHCREALQRMIAAERRCRPLFDQEDFAAPDNEPESLVDLHVAIESLDEPQRSILSRRAKGQSLQEIAHDQGLSYSQTWRLARRAIEQLRAKLAT